MPLAERSGLIRNSPFQQWVSDRVYGEAFDDLDVLLQGA
jgi:hypothetical protein